MPAARLDNEERRRAIVATAVPLFARKGFAGTTTKEIAAAARVSEALLFKHFPSKAALYEEILRLGCEGDARLERLISLEPSTAGLIDMVHFILRYSVIGVGLENELETRQRLMVNSFLEDGEYARLGLRWMAERILPKVEACLVAAQAATHTNAGRYAEPAQPIAYDKLGAYMKASPRQRARGDWADSATAAAMPAASAAGGGYTGVDTSATTSAPASQASPEAPTPQTQPSTGTNP